MPVFHMLLAGQLAGCGSSMPFFSLTFVVVLMLKRRLFEKPQD